MPKVAATLFVISTVLNACAISIVVAWPILDDLRTRKVFELYSLGNSNLDVWLLSVAQQIIFVLLLLLAAQIKKSATAERVNRQQKVLCGLWVTFLLTQLLLLAKATLVAVFGGDNLYPCCHPGNCGLLSTALSILSTFVFLYIQYFSAAACVKALQSDVSKGDDLSLPLLDKGEEEPEKEDKIKSDTIRSLFSMSVPDTPILLVAFAAGSLAALAQAYIPFFTGRIIEYASIQPDRQRFNQEICLLLVTALCCAVTGGVRGGLFSFTMTRLNVRIRTRLFHSLLQQEVGFFDTNKTGEISSRLSADTTTVADQISLNLNVMFRSLTEAATILVFMFHASWRLTIVTFVLVPLILLICKVYGAYYKERVTKVQSELAAANSVAEETLSTMTTVKAFAAEDSVEAAYAEKLDNFYRLDRVAAVMYAAYAIVVNLLPSVVAALVLYYGGILVLSGHMSAGSLVSFMLYHQRLSSSFQSIGDVFSALTAAVGAADKVVKLIDRKPKIVTDGALIPHQFQGSIEFKEVVMRYPARPEVQVLRGLSFDVRPGEVVALVGPSGGGKSSIVKLLQQYYRPESGVVLLDGRDLGVYNNKWLRRQVSLVSQEPVLYGRSIRRNIVYGLEEADGVPPQDRATQQNIEEAAKLANAHDFICGLPCGYDTECGEKGVALSGGQKQRIAIARALVRKPALLLLDEATSALDADSEAVVQEALERTMSNRTVLVIAHRLSTIQNAHRIIVLRKGAVAEMGSHDELIGQAGVYAQLVKRQMQKASAPASDTASLRHSASCLSTTSLSSLT